MSRSDSTSGSPLESEIVLASDLSLVSGFRDRLESFLNHHGVDPEDVFSITLAVEEAVINAIKHGNQLDPSKSVRIHYVLSTTSFDVRITDEGQGYDPTEVPDPTRPEYLERSSGRGLLIIQHYMSEVVFNDLANSIRMIRHLTESAPEIN